MDDRLSIDVSRLFDQDIATSDLIAPVVLRLAGSKKQRDIGSCEIEVKVRLNAAARRLRVNVTWSLSIIELERRYPLVRQDLSRLARSKSPRQITESAAIGMAFLLIPALLPGARITKVVPLGGRGDFFLNGRDDEMIEVSGTMDADIDRRFRERSRQVLRNPTLRRAYANVTRFLHPASRLDRVK